MVQFEKLSGSGALKAAYDEAKAELESREAEMTAGFEEKRLISREKNQMKQQKEEAEEYNTTLEDYKATKRNYCLFQLFRLQVDIDAKQAAARGVAKDLRARTSALDVLRASVADLSSSTAKLRKETQVSEKKLQKSTAELDKKRPQQIKVKQELVHASKSIEKERQLLQLAQQEATDHADKVKLLEKDLKKAQRLYAELEAALEAEDEKSKELKLAADQAKEYNELKAKSAVETAEAHGALKQAEHDQRVAQERFDAIRVLMANIQERVDALRESTDELKKKAAKNVDAAKQAKADLADMKKKLAEMRAKAAQATSDQHRHRAGRTGCVQCVLTFAVCWLLVLSKRKGELDVELFSVQEKLTDAASDRREREGDLKLRDTIDTLRAHFPSVRGSLSELCDVTHPKYSTAMAVVFGRHIDSVVVADQKTALECINYLKEQRLGMLTFIPLDTIKVKPISEANRQMRERGFPLAIDCINFDEEIEKAYIYALSDTLICDSERDEAGAIKKASDQAAGHKHKIVTLGGTVIHKSGNMTGGTSTRADSKGGKLKSAAEKSASKALINEKEYQKLVKRRDELVEELLRLEEEGKQAHRQQDEEAKLAGKIVSLESRLKYIEIDVEASTKKVADNEKKIKAMETEIEKNQPIASEIEEKVKEKVRARDVGEGCACRCCTPTEGGSSFASLVCFLFPLVVVGCRRCDHRRSGKARGEDLSRLLSSRRPRQHSRVRERAPEAGRPVPRGEGSTDDGGHPPQERTRLRAQSRPREGDHHRTTAHQRTRGEDEARARDGGQGGGRTREGEGEGRRAARGEQANREGDGQEAAGAQGSQEEMSVPVRARLTP